MLLNIKSALAFEEFNTVIKEYPNGTKSIKVFKFYSSYLKPGYEKNTDYDDIHDIEFINKMGLPKFDENVKKISVTEEQSNLKQLQENIYKTRTKIYDISVSNYWNYFITLTFNSESVDRYKYSSCIKKITKFLNNFSQRNKGNCPNFKYILVHEKHKDGAFHFHGLLHIEDKSLLKNALFPKGHKKEGTQIIKNGHLIYNWSNYNLGYSTVSEIVNLDYCCQYILKYITKDISDDYIKRRRKFIYSSNCDKPNIIRKACDITDLLNDNKISLTFESDSSYFFKSI